MVIMAVIIIMLFCISCILIATDVKEQKRKEKEGEKAIIARAIEVFERRENLRAKIEEYNNGWDTLTVAIFSILVDENKEMTKEELEKYFSEEEEVTCAKIGYRLTRLCLEGKVEKRAFKREDGRMGVCYRAI